ncbi:phospholipase A2 AP-PLA2-I-like [Patiria miniata]|uniref:Phospholipase A2-like central domain-containing protein n=1 Tax=Patiria miniata TaxID=46514 RepID=A0A913ZDS4_PATMI|nr:phospholipase A2 AP-PLA2-I-like [Patiria miniata]
MLFKTLAHLLVGLGTISPRDDQLAGMIECTIDSSAPVKYADYGCFCGEGSAGATPVDDTDSCCQAHEQCYDGSLAASIGCSSSDRDDLPYEYSTHHVFSRCSVQCDPVEDYPADQDKAACRVYLCECDCQLAQCLKDAAGSYNGDYVEYRDTEAGQAQCV